MHIGIDLLWVRPGICGGTEAFIRNLMDGFALYDKENHYTLFVAQDNAESFAHYAESTRDSVEGTGQDAPSCNMTLKVCPVKCESQPKRIFWENRHLDKVAKETMVDVMFIPVYSKPRSGKKLPYVTVIHDLQAMHYPQYFSFPRRMFLKYAWRYTCKSSKMVVTISDYCKEDLIRHYPKVKEKIVTIYNPILTRQYSADFSDVAQKYDLQKGQYFYCVSSTLPHKNLDTILQVMAEWQGSEKLVLSGVGAQTDALKDKLVQYKIEERVILTGFVSDGERDSLYENCSLFLFPSVFEGFGMPPIEAMRKGKRVVMTKESCLLEVTKGRAVYVDDPYSATEWRERMAAALTLPEKKVAFAEYSLEEVTGRYVKVLKGVLE